MLFTRTLDELRLGILNYTTIYFAKNSQQYSRSYIKNNWERVEFFQELPTLHSCNTSIHLSHARRLRDVKNSQILEKYSIELQTRKFGMQSVGKLKLTGPYRNILMNQSWSMPNIYVIHQFSL
jgi:hypothetical protein